MSAISETRVLRFIRIIINDKCIYYILFDKTSVNYDKKLLYVKKMSPFINGYTLILKCFLLTEYSPYNIID